MFPAPKNKWRSSASLEVLQIRAQTLKQIRDFFAQRQVLEVETPLMCRSAATDPILNPIPVLYASVSYAKPSTALYYLQTSPEYAMKRLLASGSGSIYQISRAFRGEESGRLHNPEFTLLEWYRVNFDHHALMNEVDDLLRLILETPKAQRLSYETLFQSSLKIDPHRCTLQELKDCAEKNQITLSPLAAQDLGVDEWLDILMTHCIEPSLGFEKPVFVEDYPASKAALAKIRVREDGMQVAERFEVYVRGVELANGYHELTDAALQRQRFKEDCVQRTKAQLPSIPIDESVLAALESGLPPCAGIALGLDRLIMLKEGLDHIAQTLSFGIDRV